MAKARDYAGEPRSEATDLKHIPDGGYERSIGKAGGEKGVEKKIRSNTGDPTSDNDAGLSGKLPK